MSADRIWKLIARKLSQEASQEELQELDQLLRNHPDLHFPIQTISDIWQSQSQQDESSSLENHYQDHIQQMLNKGIIVPQPGEEHSDSTYLLEGTRRKSRKRYLALLAILLPLLFGGYWYYSSSKKPLISEAKPQQQKFH